MSCRTCGHDWSHHIPGQPLPKVGVCADYVGAEELFSQRGIDFKLGRSGRWWQLRFLTNGRWESLSIWSTRAEAMRAADMFIPARRLT